MYGQWSNKHKIRINLPYPNINVTKSVNVEFKEVNVAYPFQNKPI